MLKRPCSALMLILGLSAESAFARDLLVEVEVVHIAGKLAPAQLEARFADERLSVEADYDPTRLIDGVTARRERIMPIGTKLFAISRNLTVTAAQIERQGRLLRFQLPDAHPEHPEYYRLHTLRVRVPAAPGRGRGQPDERIGVTSVPPKAGAHETAFLTRFGESDIGVRVRHRWSDAQGETVLEPMKCHFNVQSLGDGRYRFRTEHPQAGEFRDLASTAQSDPPSRPPAGQRSFRMREPYPEPMANWQLTHSHLVQLHVDGQPVERFSVNARESGAGQCLRTHSYEALFAGSQLVALRRSMNEKECNPDGSRQHVWIEASWLEDGSLAKYLATIPQGKREWDAFLAAAGCAAGGAPPPAGEVEALTAEFQRIRAAFLRP
jgi:hypothetical protein